LISSSCISRYSSFLLLPDTESSDGKAVTLTVSVTSSGREEIVAWRTSSSLNLPDRRKDLHIYQVDKDIIEYIIDKEGEQEN
jgi:hypothetical protein